MPETRLRRTRQRAAVFGALQRSGDFVSAQQLHAQLATAGVAVGLTTVYRTLRELERAGRVDVVRDESGERLYRPRPDAGHRHYLICRSCGLSRAVDTDVVERWAGRLAAATGFADIEHTLELSGVCARCLPDQR
ncbi:Fur family transcriptional regulator [Streptomyces synnematoformans]|uniref:Fur family transcriptional regulator n=1 Tax=Streptomyces synnematoformans TaxID=415721 RepID=UPI0031DE5623